MKKLLFVLLAIVFTVSLTACKGGEEEVTEVELDVFMSFPRFQEQFEDYFELFKTKMVLLM